MICPFCLHKKTGVYNSRKTSRLNQVWRRRECAVCHKQFTTRENIDLSDIIKVKEPGNRRFVVFSAVKLMSSIARAVDHLGKVDEITYYLTQTAQNKLLTAAAKNSENALSLHDISKVISDILYHYNYTSYVKYASAHDLPVRRQR